MVGKSNRGERHELEEEQRLPPLSKVFIGPSDELEYSS